jgi:hypothetical protein
MTAGEAFRIVARLAGVPAPLLLLDAKVTAPLQPLTSWLEGFVTLPPLLSSEMTRTLGATYMFTSTKTERQLGYTHRSIEEGMAETVVWEAAQFHGQPAFVTPRQQTATLLALFAVALLLGVILLRRRHDQA